MTAAVGATGQRAGFVTRLAAMIADTLILWFGLRGSVSLALVLRHALRRFAPPVDVEHLVVIGAPAIASLYHILFWWLRGQTPGKWLLGVKVVALGRGKVGLARSLVRFAGYLLSALPFYLGFIWIIGGERRGFHDRLARTEVVYTRRPVRPPRHPEERSLIPVGIRPLSGRLEDATSDIAESAAVCSHTHGSYRPTLTRGRARRSAVVRVRILRKPRGAREAVPIAF
jgi:uncharacterized RDD family membrane protein YckC